MKNRYNNVTNVIKSGFPGAFAAVLIFAGILGTAQNVQAEEAPYDSLFLVGDAPPNGWSISDPTPMQQSAENPWIFVYEGMLNPGELKISTFTGDWCDGDWLLAPSQHPELQDVDQTGYTVYEGCAPEEEDFKWLIDRDEISEYVVTVNLQEETVSFEYLGPQEVDYDELFLVGNALATGWSIEDPTPMEQSSTYPWIFSYEGFFSFGEFKISTFTGDWCDGDWIRPPSMHPPLSDADFIITSGCPADGEDYTWEITTDDVGDYRITVDLMEETITIAEIDADAPPFDELYLVGDATPGGWSLDEQTPMQRDPDNPFLFTWSGDLVAGEFKIKGYAENDFCGGDWIHPIENGQAFSQDDYQVLEGCGPHDDPKWVVTEELAGQFDITVDTELETIVFSGENVSTAADDTDTDLPSVFRLEKNYPNPFNPATSIRYQVSERSDVTIRVYDITGRQVATLVNGVHESGTHTVVFDAANLASGLYIYRMQAGNFSQTHKMMLVK